MRGQKNSLCHKTTLLCKPEISSFRKGASTDAQTFATDENPNGGRKPGKTRNRVFNTITIMTPSEIKFLLLSADVNASNSCLACSNAIRTLMPSWILGTPVLEEGENLLCIYTLEVHYHFGADTPNEIRSLR
jgi:hypothetical protein